jgi:hypothetical protein
MLIGNTMTLKLLSPSNKRGDGELLIKEEKEKKKKLLRLLCGIINYPN